MRIKTPAQPLVFRYQGATALLTAVAELYGSCPQLRSRLCLYAGWYYLAVKAGLRERPAVRSVAGEYGEDLGASPVLYAYYAEHGRELSGNAVQELGAALGRRKSG